MAIFAIPYWSWAHFSVLAVGVFALAPLGINIGYHRLLTHRSFATPNWLRNSLVTLGAALGGGPPIHFVAMHRIHHRYSDQERDPYNAGRGFWYSHLLHHFMVEEQESRGEYLKIYAPELLSDRYLFWLNKNWMWLAIATLPALYLIGGVGLVLWGGFLRLAVTWHIMWFVNSASHLWGYRNYPSPDNTVNCWWVGLLGAGEGWHNNHHAYPSCAKHGHKWWEFDLSYLFIAGLVRLGLASKVKRLPRV